MAIRMRFDHHKRLVQTYFSKNVSLRQFALYAREFTLLPIKETPLIIFTNASKVKRVEFTADQMIPHSEQIVARLVDGGDVAATIILAPGKILPFATSFRHIAGDAFPVEVYEDTDRALDRFHGLLDQRPADRRVPVSKGS